ncbi:MAG: pyridoxal-phosphate dependent enzyme [Gemmatimonadetes bacterium]|nr:pyridoxal-phosphate dependent enzyme [Gemmatimonadota bacterium]
MALRTPLIPLYADGAGSAEIYLKLENLQPIGSFKLRGAGNAVLKAGKETLSGGVYTASAGNHAQGVAWAARILGVPCTIIVPEHAPTTKLAAITRLGGKIIKLPYEEWWQVIEQHGRPGMSGRFIHPVADPDIIAGNGTAGLEILEDLPDVDVVIVPYGGGGLSCGIASALRAMRSKAKVFAAEVDTAAPLSASFKARAPQTVERKQTFIDGIGAKNILPEMWPLASTLLAGSLVSSVADIVLTLRMMVERNHVVAEGAGAAPVAAALSGRAGGTKVVAVVSGGNIEPAILAKILLGETP